MSAKPILDSLLCEDLVGVAQSRCILCEAVDGFEYVINEPGAADRITCAIDSRGLCNRPACVRARRIPVAVRPKARRTPRFHPSIRAWVYSQKRHDRDPNTRHPERMAGKFVQGSVFRQSLSSELFHIFCMQVDDKDSFQKFAVTLRESVSKTRRWLLEQADEHHSSLSAGTTRQDVKDKIEKQRVAIEELRKSFDDRPEPPSELGEVVDFQEWNETVNAALKKDWEKEKIDGERLCDELFAEWLNEKPTEDLDIRRYHLMRFAAVLIPGKPLLSSEIAEIKTEGFDRGIRYPAAVTQETDADKVSALAGTVSDSDDEFVETDEYAEATTAAADGDESQTFGQRKTTDPVNRSDLNEIFRSAFNPSGTKSREDVKQDIRKDRHAAILYTTIVDNIPRENVGRYFGEENVNTVTQRLRRKGQEIERKAVQASRTSEHFPPGELQKHFPKDCGRKDGLYVRVKFPRKSWMFYPLAVEPIAQPVNGRAPDYDDDAVDRALQDLQVRLGSEKLRKNAASLTPAESYNRGYEVGIYLRDVFSLAELHYLTFSDAPTVLTK